MQFKVGDRVEVLEPADGLIGGRANNLGLGIVEDVDAFQVRVKVEANDQAWWYDIESVRPLTPSITVGTQVRLTGVVGDKDGDKRIRVDFGEDAEDEWAWIPCKAKCLEVIRQPFKRGEVVQYIADAEGKADGEDYVVVKDEESDSYDLLIVGTHHGDEVFCADPSLFERRP